MLNHVGSVYKSHLYANEKHTGCAVSIWFIKKNQYNEVICSWIRLVVLYDVAAGKEKFLIL